MKFFATVILLGLTAVPAVFSQSGRSAGSYSESGPARITTRSTSVDTEAEREPGPDADSSDVVRVPTDLITIPVRIISEDGKSIGELRQNEFKIFENGVEQPIA